MKTTAVSILFLTLVFAVYTQAQNFTGISVTGTAEINEADVGVLDVQGNDFLLGTLTGTSDAAVSFSYVDQAAGVSPAFTNTMARDGGIWNWKRTDDLGYAMQLDGSNRLILSSPDQSGSIVLDPSSGRLLINGSPVLTGEGSLVVTPSGYLGIGTSNPQVKLQVTGQAIIGDTGADLRQHDNEDNLLLVRGTGDSYNFWRGSATFGGDSSGITLGEFKGESRLYSWDNQGNPTNLWINTQGRTNNTYIGTPTGYPFDSCMAIQNSTGWVGIGTNSPAGPLDIWASTTDQGDSIRIVQTNPGPGDYHANVEFRTTNGTIGNIAAMGAGLFSPPYALFQANDFEIISGQGHDTTNMLLMTNNNGAIKFVTGGYNLWNERMRITPAGNVGINNTAPQSQLDVAGNTRVSGNITLTGITSTVLIPESGDLSMGAFTAGTPPQ